MSCWSGTIKGEIKEADIVRWSDQIKASRHHMVQVKLIKLTTCSEGEFTCNDGQCINIEQR